MAPLQVHLEYDEEQDGVTLQKFHFLTGSKCSVLRVSLDATNVYMGVWEVIVGVFGSSFIEGSLVTAVCGSTIEPFSPTPLSKSLTESAATLVL